MSSEGVWQVSFPPFYTLQKHSETQKKQIDTWCHLLLEFSSQNNKQVIDLNEIRQTSLFSNSEIDRRASVELIQAIFSELLSRGNVQWIDKNQTRALLCKITFPTLANSIYEWAQVSGNINQVCTFYELTSGDDIKGEVFENIDESVLKVALRILQKDKKAEIIGDDGVKFF